MEDPIYKLSISRGTLPSLRGSCGLVDCDTDPVVLDTGQCYAFNTSNCRYPKKKVETAWKGQ
jgi:hypothetical protein